ncbi:MAG: helix-turn-helix transcriptional regulator [Immundisolibacter sp.]|uniref:helix-turn-helix transcriptional regulator n=1 Tax=Immundisolibacter sp. TaxID=1934948 RepID=UPI003D0FB13E
MQFLTDRQLATRFAVGRTTIWRWTQEGRLPPAVRLSPGVTRWRLCDIEMFEARHAAAEAAETAATPAPR